MKKYKIEVIVFAEDEADSTGIVDTVRSIEIQSLNFKQNIKLSIFAGKDSRLKDFLSYYKSIYPDNIDVIFDDDIDGSIRSYLENVDSEYITFMHSGDMCQRDLFFQVYSHIEINKGNSDVAAVYLASASKLYAEYNKSFSDSCKNIHLMTTYKHTPLSLSGLFIKTFVVKEKIMLQETGTFSEIVLLTDVLMRRKNFTLIPKKYYLRICEGYQPAMGMDEFIEKCWLFDYTLDKHTQNGFLFLFIQKIIVAHLFFLLEMADDIMGDYEPLQYGYDEEWDFISILLRKIDDQVILGQVSTRDKKMFIFELKYARECDRDLYSDDMKLMYENTVLYNVSSFAARVDLMKIKGSVLTVEGYCLITKGIPIERTKIGAFINGDFIEIDQVDRLTDRYYFDRVSLHEKGFRLKTRLTGYDMSIQFAVIIDGHICYCKNLQFMRLAQIGTELNNSYYYKDGYIITTHDNKLICEAADEDKRMEMEAKVQDEILCSDNDRASYIVELRNYYFENIDKKDKQIWLFMDRPDRADDNAECFFRYMTSKENDDAQYYFVLSKDAAEYEEISKLGNVVEPASDEHRRLHLLADYVISSQMAEHSENPFNEDNIYFRDIYHEHRFIWLQHGVIHNSHGKTIGKYYKDFYGFVTSAPKEHKYLSSEIFHYDEKNMWLTGMPRFDYLYHDEKKLITIMPTWRKYLTTREFDPETNTMIWRVNDDFVESDYYNFYNELLNSEPLLKAARETGYKICFMPHVIFSNFADTFKENDVVKLISTGTKYRDVFAESKLVLTDYTSAVFDFAYLNKPVLYCQFDKERFYSEHTVKKGYFDFEKDGFGEVSYDLEDTIKTLTDYIYNDCKLKDKYRKRISKFFKFHDSKCCERIYNKIKELENDK